MSRGAVLSGHITIVAMSRSGGAGAHLNKEETSGATGHVAARSPPLQGGVVRNYSLRGSTSMHALLLVLT
jgi:hypothetical protein